MPDPATNPSKEPGLMDFMALALAWLVPGAGHLAIGQRARGFIFAITIHALFFAGWFLGGVRAISPADQPIWTYTQFLTGWPMIAARQVKSITRTPPRDYAPTIVDPGSVYCGLAGMLNMLVLFDVLVRIYGGRDEKPETPPAPAAATPPPPPPPPASAPPPGGPQ